jgi:hypothetical protein
MSRLRARFRPAVLVTSFLLTVSCADGPVEVAVPDSASASALAIGAGGRADDIVRRPPNPNSCIAFCNLAFQTPIGQFRMRTMPVRLSSEAFTGGAGTLRFAYIGWNAARTAPSALAVCEIPGSEVALEEIAAIFGAREVVGDHANARLTGPATAPAATASADVVLYEGDAGGCDPTMITCVCEDLSCGEDGGSEWEGPDPGGYDEPTWDEQAIVVEEPIVLPSVITCNSRIDNIHMSTHAPGDLNVIASTSCSQPISQSVISESQRQSCFWIFFWWSTRGPGGFDGGVKSLVRAPAPALCQTGWWRGRGTHLMSFGLGYTPMSATRGTVTYARVNWC